MKTHLGYLGIGLTVPSFWQLVSAISEGKQVWNSIYLFLFLLGVVLVGLSRWRLLLPVANGVAIAYLVYWLANTPALERGPMIVIISIFLWGAFVNSLMWSRKRAVKLWLFGFVPIAVFTAWGSPAGQLVVLGLFLTKALVRLLLKAIYLRRSTWSWSEILLPY